MWLTLLPVLTHTELMKIQRNLTIPHPIVKFFFWKIQLSSPTTWSLSDSARGTQTNRMVPSDGHLRKRKWNVCLTLLCFSILPVKYNNEASRLYAELLLSPCIPDVIPLSSLSLMCHSHLVRFHETSQDFTSQFFHLKSKAVYNSSAKNWT